MANLQYVIILWRHVLRSISHGQILADYNVVCAKVENFRKNHQIFFLRLKYLWRQDFFNSQSWNARRSLIDVNFELITSFQFKFDEADVWILYISRVLLFLHEYHSNFSLSWHINSIGQ